MQEKLFRKAALEKLSSPEELDQLMQITSPRGWLVLVALLLLVGAVVVVGVFGVMPVQVGAVYCVLGKNDEAVLQAYVFVTAATDHDIQVGDPVQVVPFRVAHSSGQFIYGTVSSVSSRPVYAEEMDEVISSPDKVDEILDEFSSVLEVGVMLATHEDGSYQWSVEPPPEIDLLPDSPCETVITTDEQSPVTLILRELG
jgi:hypothetical protein